MELLSVAQFFLKKVRLRQTRLHAFISNERLQVCIKEEDFDGKLERSKFKEVLPATVLVVIPKTQAVLVVPFVRVPEFNFMFCSIFP